VGDHCVGHCRQPEGAAAPRRLNGRAGLVVRGDDVEIWRAHTAAAARCARVRPVCAAGPDRLRPSGVLHPQIVVEPQQGPPLQHLRRWDVALRHPPRRQQLTKQLRISPVRHRKGAAKRASPPAGRRRDPTGSAAKCGLARTAGPAVPLWSRAGVMIAMMRTRNRSNGACAWRLRRRRCQAGRSCVDRGGTCGQGAFTCIPAARRATSLKVATTRTVEAGEHDGRWAWDPR
jgi:hypothetical protein